MNTTNTIKDQFEIANKFNNYILRQYRTRSNLRLAKKIKCIQYKF